MRLFLCLCLYFLLQVNLIFAAPPQAEKINPDEVYGLRRARAHLAIGDHSKAVAELKIFLLKNPQSKKLREVMIEALSQNGQEMEAIKFWKESIEIFPDLEADENILETLAWGVLQKEEKSTHLIANIFTMIGASLTHDVKSVGILLKGLKSTNAYLRMIAVKLSAHFGDRVLIEEIQKILVKDSSWYVRLECMKTLGALHIESLEELLKEVLASSRSSLEEKVVAIQAYINLNIDLSDQDIVSFLQNRRTGLRLLGCQLMIFLEKKELLSHVIPLFDDPSLEVKIASIDVVALLGVKGTLKDEAIQKLKSHLHNEPYEISITAAWALMLLDCGEGEKVLEKYLKSGEIEEARLAASALALTGHHGLELAMKIIKSHHDPYVRANISLGILGFIKNNQAPLQALYQFLVSTEEKIMWHKKLNPLFDMVVPSEIKHTPEIPHYPTVVDDHTRLQLYNILAMMRYKEAQRGIKEYLKTHSVGVTFAASSALLEEGAEDALELIRGLLSDPDPLIQIQAALVLATIGSDPDSLSVLMTLYPKVERELKIHILEALGHLGKRDTVAFLSHLLDDSFHSIRILAASSIIQCLHH